MSDQNGVGNETPEGGRTVELPSPYARPETNVLYNMLFCDDLSLFRPPKGDSPAHWQAILFGDHPDAAAVRKIADDPEAESRVRILAYKWLRDFGHPVPAKLLLGVVVEVPLEGGLDVLAAYGDGRVRYINYTGRFSIFESGPPEVQAKAREVVSAAKPVVSKIGPWDKRRLPPPGAGGIRMSFLVSDGLYFGEGPFSLMAREPMAAPIIQKAGELLKLAVDAAAG